MPGHSADGMMRTGVSPARPPGTLLFLREPRKREYVPTPE